MPCILPFLSLFGATYSAATVEAQVGMRMAILHPSSDDHCATKTPGRVHVLLPETCVVGWMSVLLPRIHLRWSERTYPGAS